MPPQFLFRSFLTFATDYTNFLSGFGRVERIIPLRKSYAKRFYERHSPSIDQECNPLLIVAYCREGKTVLLLMYLAQADGLPVPSSEIKGLLLLEKENIHRLCREPYTLENI
jgi:hypothetical protein